MGDTYTCQPLPSVKHLHPYGTCVQTSYTAACCKYYERSWWMGTKNPRADVMARSWWSLCLGGDRKSILIWFWQKRTPCGGTMLECSGALVSFETVGGWQVFSSVQTLFRSMAAGRQRHLDRLCCLIGPQGDGDMRHHSSTWSELARINKHPDIHIAAKVFLSSYLFFHEMCAFSINLDLK